MRDSTFGSNGCNASIYLLRPDGSTVMSGQSCANTNYGIAYRNVAIDTAGTWAVIVDAPGATTGTANVSLTLKSGTLVPTY